MSDSDIRDELRTLFRDFIGAAAGRALETRDAPAAEESAVEEATDADDVRVRREA